MRLVSFSVRRYRSITEAERIPVRDLTLLVGANNEGKSNLLKALDLSLGIITNPRRISRSGGRIPSYYLRNYDWERDFPVALRARARGSKESSFTIEFELTDAEIQEFFNSVGSRLNGTLPILITIGQGSASLKISKQGRGAAVLNSKLESILEFVQRRVTYTYIPSVRTADQSTRVVELILSEELSVIEDDPQYQNALEAVSQLQEPVLRQVSEAIRTTLTDFLPGVRSARIVIQEAARHAALRRSVSVLIDDGDETDLRQKGDGVQSLAAIAMMRFASQRSAGSRHIILSVEEPESHLHPAAVQQVRKVLQEIAERHQVIVTSHSPELVDRINVRSNILVSDKRARTARSIQGVRDALGVQPSHNLQSAELMVLVEGPSDVSSVSALAKTESTRLRNAIDSGVLGMVSLDGVGNLSNFARILNSNVQPVHCFLDNDDPARAAYETALERGVLVAREVNLASSQGQVQSELEDLIRVEVYRDALEREFGVTLEHPPFRSARKWSERCREVFIAQGRAWDDATQSRAKMIVAEGVASSPAEALAPARRVSFDSFLAALAARLSSLRV